MGFIAKLKSELVGNFSTVIFGAACSAIGAASVATVANFWRVFDLDPVAAVALCSASFILGVIAGAIVSFAVSRYGRVGRMRRLLCRLPVKQRAACWGAYCSEGAFSDGEHAADLEILSRLEAVEKVVGKGRPMWALSQSAREAIAGSRRLSEELEKSAEQRYALEAEKSHEERISNARQCIENLDFYGRRRLAKMIDQGSVKAPTSRRGNVIGIWGNALVKIEEVSPVEMEVSPTADAVEADRLDPSLLAKAREYEDGDGEAWARFS